MLKIKSFDGSEWDCIATVMGYAVVINGIGRYVIMYSPTYKHGESFPQDFTFGGGYVHEYKGAEEAIDGLFEKIKSKFERERK